MPFGDCAQCFFDSFLVLLVVIVGQVVDVVFVVVDIATAMMEWCCFESRRM